MLSLRHVGRAIQHVSKKKRGIWHLKDGNELIDLSGGPLLETITPPTSLSSSVLYENVGASGGIETDVRIDLEAEIFHCSKMPQGSGILWASSGSDAIEFAIWAVSQKLSNSISEIPAFIVRLGSYHGNTFLTRYLSTRKNIINFAKPSLFERYILRETELDEDQLISQTIDQLEQYKFSNGAILLLETVATTGRVFWPGFKYYETIISWCTKNNIEVILDEIAAGVYRHGWFSAAQHLKQMPAALTLAKGLTSGMYPLSCVLLRPDIAKSIESKQERYPAFTYGLNDTGASICSKYLRRYAELIENNDIQERIILINKFSKIFASINSNLFFIEGSPTSIRISMKCHDGASRFKKMLVSRKILVYEASTDFGDEKIHFFLISPALDMSNTLLEDVLNEIKIIMEKFDA